MTEIDLLQQIIVPNLPSPIALDREANNSILRTTAFDTIALHCIALQPNSTTFKAVSHLCICGHYLIDYGSCSLFLHTNYKHKH